MEAGERFPVRVERNVLIPMTDGISLAADLFLPDASGPFPCLVSYYPYHKDDLIGALFDHPNRYFAARGYANVLVDLRGLGNSEGAAWDVADPREAADGRAIVEWAGAQAWCDGSVGMWGMSYGGITSLQTAAQRPPSLKAIVPMNAAIDHYRDIVYPGGCFNMLGILGGWGPFMTAMNVMPPMHQDSDGRWSRIWQDRLDQNHAPSIKAYQEHPAYDEYWTSKAIAVERIQVPTFLIGAWRDIFPESMVRAYERIPAPRRLMMGPWMHEMPDLAAFAQVDYLALMQRWWDCWLKGEANGVPDEPPVTLYVQGQGWRTEREWPIARSRDSRIYLGLGDGSGTLATVTPADAFETTYQADPTVGVQAGLWDPTGTGLGLPQDQGPDDLRSITFTGEPLSSDHEVTGSGDATLFVVLDEGEDLHLVVKLCDVAPDGHSTLVTTGWLNASHRLTPGKPVSPPLGEVLEYHVPLWCTSYVVPAGHRLRVSVSCSDFPRIWPTRTNPRIRLAAGGATPSSVCLPIVPAGDSMESALPVPDATVKRTPLEIEAKARWGIARDMGDGNVVVSTGVRTAIESVSRDGRFEIDRTGRASVSAARPDGAFVEGESTIRLRTPQGSDVLVAARLRITLDSQDYRASVRVDGQVVFDGHWDSQRPRS
jgi:putative CocE/NonD family hydrolase